ncbi:hypothetical protein [Pseudoduganella sp. R-34]|uniref:hypothetical protein n=1 Tax=Pseudoduganella sp. R-34 TaxID=3404062 RepID=UPI003CE89B23
MTAGEWMAYLVVYGGGALVILFMWAYINYFRAQQRNLKELFASGFKADHRVGNEKVFVFDDSLREMAIIDGAKLHRYPYAKIDTWSHECDVRGNRKIHNRLVITILDAEHPRHEIRVSANEGQLWFAKMRAILAK